MCACRCLRLEMVRRSTDFSIYAASRLRRGSQERVLTSRSADPFARSGTGGRSLSLREELRKGSNACSSPTAVVRVRVVRCRLVRGVANRYIPRCVCDCSVSGGSLSGLCPGGRIGRSAVVVPRRGFTLRVPLLRIDQLKRTQPPPHILAALLFVLRSTTGMHLR